MAVARSRKELRRYLPDRIVGQDLKGKYRPEDSIPLVVIWLGYLVSNSVAIGGWSAGDNFCGRPFPNGTEVAEAKGG
jgi:hypothetical protein